MNDGSYSESEGMSFSERENEIAMIKHAAIPPPRIQRVVALLDSRKSWSLFAAFVFSGLFERVKVSLGVFSIALKSLNSETLLAFAPVLEKAVTLPLRTSIFLPSLKLCSSLGPAARFEIGAPSSLKSLPFGIPSHISACKLKLTKT